MLTTHQHYLNMQAHRGNKSLFFNLININFNQKYGGSMKPDYQLILPLS